MNYKTPGVKVEEIATLPPSVAAVDTAVPAFVGYTKNAVSEVTKINSFLDFVEIFGGADSDFDAKVAQNSLTATHTAATVTLDGNNNVISSTIDYTVQDISDLGTPDLGVTSTYKLYYGMKLFFQNGGGKCYVASAGQFNATNTNAVAKNDLTAALDKIKRVDEPTMLVVPDAISLPSKNDFKDVMQHALLQCNDLQDRFTIMDVYPNADFDQSITDFRTDIGTSYLNYGAAYAPNLSLGEQSLSITGITVNPSIIADTIVEVIGGDDGSAKTTVKSVLDPLNTAIQGAVDLATAQGLVTAAIAANVGPSNTNTALVALETILNNTIDGVDDLADYKTAVPAGITTVISAVPAVNFAANSTLNAVTVSADATINKITVLAAVQSNYQSLAQASVNNLATEFQAASEVQIGPSAVMAGVYSKTDSDRGVWKAPANVSISGAKPIIKIDNDLQNDLNVDPNGNGKSINAIRNFTGKGNLVWGARTLAANDLEWRYVNVRRLFIFVEESVKKAADQFVFEGNNAQTWSRVKGMIENFLTGIWRQGGLAGAKPGDAFQVRIGLGSTMTTSDVLEGRMNVEISMAPSRPAEFIVLKFSHKLQEA